MAKLPSFTCCAGLLKFETFFPQIQGTISGCTGPIIVWNHLHTFFMLNPNMAMNFFIFFIFILFLFFWNFWPVVCTRHFGRGIRQVLFFWQPREISLMFLTGVDVDRPLKVKLCWCPFSSVPDVSNHTENKSSLSLCSTMFKLVK